MQNRLFRIVILSISFFFCKMFILDCDIVSLLSLPNCTSSSSAISLSELESEHVEFVKLMGGDKNFLSSLSTEERLAFMSSKWFICCVPSQVKWRFLHRFSNFGLFNRLISSSFSCPVGHCLL